MKPPIFSYSLTIWHMIAIMVIVLVASKLVAVTLSFVKTDADYHLLIQMTIILFTTYFLIIYIVIDTSSPEYKEYQVKKAEYEAYLVKRKLVVDQLKRDQEWEIEEKIKKYKGRV